MFNMSNGIFNLNRRGYTNLEARQGAASRYPKATEASLEKRYGFRAMVNDDTRFLTKVKRFLTDFATTEADRRHNQTIKQKERK